MIELVKAFANIASLMNLVVYHKAKSLGYYEVMEFMDKEERQSKCKLPSFTSTSNLGTSNFIDTESNIDTILQLQTEKEWLTYLKNIYYTGPPGDITKCSLT